MKCLLKVSHWIKLQGNRREEKGESCVAKTVSWEHNCAAGSLCSANIHRCPLLTVVLGSKPCSQHLERLATRPHLRSAVPWAQPPGRGPPSLYSTKNNSLCHTCAGLVTHCADSESGCISHWKPPHPTSVLPSRAGWGAPTHYRHPGSANTE